MKHQADIELIPNDSTYECEIFGSHSNEENKSIIMQTNIRSAETTYIVKNHKKEIARYNDVEFAIEDYNKI